MKQEEYNSFLTSIKSDFIDFILNYNVPADFIKEGNESKCTLYLNKYGKTNVLFESFENLPKNEKDSNTFIIPIKFFNLNENHKKVFNFDCGSLNDKDGTLILFSKENGLDSLKNTFKRILEIWAEEHDKKKLVSMIIPN